ncbi:hypothetical protein D9M70_481320 [compost metagenome]
MHGAAKTEAHRRDAGQRAAQYRHQSQHQQRHRTVDRQQQRDDDGHADGRQALDVVPDGVARLDGEDAGAGHRELVGAVCRGLGKGIADCVDGLRLRVRIRTRGRALRQQHRALAVARGPGAGMQRGALAGVELRQHCRDLAGGVAWQQCLGEEAGRRGQQLERIVHGVRQAVLAETLRRDRRAEQVAVSVDVLAVGVLVQRLAVLDRGEARIAPQLRRHRARDRGAAIGVAAFDADQDQPRHQPVAQLADQQLLLGARQPRQEGGQVGGEAGAADHRRARQQRDQPQRQRQARAGQREAPRR